MDAFSFEVARGAERCCGKREGYSVILCNSDNKQSKRKERYIQILQEKMVDGIILTASEEWYKCKSLDRIILLW